MNEETEAALMRAGHQIDALQRHVDRLRAALHRIERVALIDPPHPGMSLVIAEAARAALCG